MKQIDRIRNMNAEELAETISEYLICEKCDFESCNGDKTKCADVYKAWLESEVVAEVVRGVAVLDHVPDGWRVLGGASNAPRGYYFISNNKSRFGGEYQHALVKEEIAIEWWINNT